MKTTIKQLRNFIKESIQGFLNEVKCRDCGDVNDYAEANMKDGSWVCRKCREYSGIKEEKPESTQKQNTINDFEIGDYVRYDGSHDENDVPEFGTVHDIDYEYNILVIETEDGEHREWDPHTCTKENMI